MGYAFVGRGTHALNSGASCTSKGVGQSTFDRLQQLLGGEWAFEQINDAELHEPNRRLHVIGTGDDNHGQVLWIADQAFYLIKTVWQTTETTEDTRTVDVLTPQQDIID
jgi:hypothetical protein